MITIIAAVANDNALGKNNQLIWHLPNDLKRFKKVTSGHAIIMGRKTFDSLGKALPNRKNIVITRDRNYQNDTVFVAHSLEEALENCLDDPQPFIIGGAQIYKQAMLLADKLDITLVHHSFDADVFFPEIDTTIWEVISREDFKADQKNKYDYSFVSFIKK